jgi:7,8-dihydro-6-hydroxymethylpterin-pyrophosphokinase
MSDLQMENDVLDIYPRIGLFQKMSILTPEGDREVIDIDIIIYGDVRKENSTSKKPHENRKLFPGQTKAPS